MKNSFAAGLVVASFHDAVISTPPPFELNKSSSKSRKTHFSAFLEVES